MLLYSINQVCNVVSLPSCKDRSLIIPGDAVAALAPALVLRRRVVRVPPVERTNEEPTLDDTLPVSVPLLDGTCGWGWVWVWDFCSDCA